LRYGTWDADDCRCSTSMYDSVSDWEYSDSFERTYGWQKSSWKKTNSMLDDLTEGETYQEMKTLREERLRQREAVKPAKQQYILNFMIM